MRKLFGDKRGFGFDLNGKLSGMIFKRWHKSSGLKRWRF